MEEYIEVISMVVLTEYLAKNVRIRCGDNTVNLMEPEQRQLIKWFLVTKPELIREIVCEDCPEHV